ncbi:MAG: hypothetical protein HPY59_03490 [Anaerolineae bacterium]|nr:hypothetical protein [Anaerolineae bacterium]
MTSRYFLGIDVGTTNIKVVLYNDQLEMVQSAAVKTATPSQRDEGLIEVNYLRHQVFSAISQCMDAQNNSAVQAIGICGMAEAGCLLDDLDQPLTPVHLWYEDRSRLFANKIRRDLGSLVASQCGLKVTHVRSLSKFAWLIARTGYSTARWIGVPELVGLWLSGNYGTDATLATRTGIYNVCSKKYSSEILDYLHARQDQFPPVYSAPACIGSIQPDVGCKLGLNGDALIFIAGHDDIVAAYGVNAEPGDLVDSTGTAEGIIRVVDRLVHPGDLAKFGIAIAPYFSERSYALITGAGTTGALIEVLAREIGLEFDVLDNNISPPSSYHRNDFRVKLSETRMPIILRNDLQDRPFELWSALYDVIAERFRRAANKFLRFCDAPRRVIFIGGSAKSAELCRRKSSKLNLSFIRAPEIDATTRGAAAVAGFAIGDQPRLWDQLV